jgi:peptidase E
VGACARAIRTRLAQGSSVGAHRVPEHGEGALARSAQEADVILVDGGNTPYLSHWLYASGLAVELPRLLESKVYAGVGAGSMIVSDSFHIDKQELRNTGVYRDDQYGDIAPPDAGSDRTLRLVPFTLRPHLGADYFDHVSMEDMERQAAMVDTPLYAIDDQAAIRVEDDMVTVVSEGDWRLLTNSHCRPSERHASAPRRPRCARARSAVRAPVRHRRPGPTPASDPHHLRTEPHPLALRDHTVARPEWRALSVQRAGKA